MTAGIKGFGLPEIIAGTIPINDTTSNAINVYGKRIVAIAMPAAFTGTAISFTAATTLGGTYKTVTDTSGTAISITVSASKYILVLPADLCGLQYLKIISNGTETAARAIELVVMPGL